MRHFKITLVLFFTSITCEAQNFGQNLNPVSLDSIEISEANKSLLHSIFVFLQNLPVRDKYSQESIDSIRSGLSLFYLPQIRSLENDLTNSEVFKLTKSNEPLLHLLGFWFLSRRIVSQKDIVREFIRITNIPKKSYELTFYCLCEPYAFGYFKTPYLLPTPFICFDMISHRYSIWENCLLLTGKYKRKANKAIRRFKSRMESEMLTIH